MIKILFSDLDGTLIHYHQPEIEPEVFNAIKELNEAGIIFCPSSGRVHTSLRQMFAPVADDVYFICENGAAVFYKNEMVAAKTMSREDYLKVAHDFMDKTDGKGEVLLTSATGAHVVDRGRGICQAMDGLKVRYKVYKKPEEIEDPGICKVALFIREGIGPYVSLFNELEKDWNPAHSAFDWFDTGCANKGDGVKMVCSALGIDMSEAAALGDNYNDEAMLDAVGFPFIMSSSADALKSKYKRHVDDPAATIRQIAKGII